MKDHSSTETDTESSTETHRSDRAGHSADRAPGFDTGDVDVPEVQRLQARLGPRTVQRLAREGRLPGQDSAGEGEAVAEQLGSSAEDLQAALGEPRGPTAASRAERAGRTATAGEGAVQRAGSGPDRAGETGVPESVREVVSSPGQALDTSIQRAMEDRTGDSLGDVRIHTGPRAARACEVIDARAVTVGNHVAFTHGEYDPSSAEGQHVLAHELAHVRRETRVARLPSPGSHDSTGRQQTGGAVSMLP